MAIFNSYVSLPEGRICVILRAKHIATSAAILVLRGILLQKICVRLLVNCDIQPDCYTVKL